ncbi:hypothetical protein CB1_006505002 [Camelus ferus]|nr:hypothetical protein CB1_006505002 [Camelus ferus]
MLIQFRDLRKYWNVDKIDWGIWVSTYIFSICFAANVGLLFGVVCTVAIVIGRFPSLARILEIQCNLGLPTAKSHPWYHLLVSFPPLELSVTCKETVHQVKIVLINNPLVFLNAKKFRADLMNIIQRENTSSQPHDEISKVYTDSNSKSVDVSFAHCTASLIRAMKYCGNLDPEKPIFFESVPAALSSIHSNKILQIDLYFDKCGVT